MAALGRKVYAITEHGAIEVGRFGAEWLELNEGIQTAFEKKA